MMRLRASFAPKSGFAQKSAFVPQPVTARAPAARLLRAGAAAFALCAAGLSTPAAAQLFFEPFAYRFQIPPAERELDPPMRPREASEAARAQGFEPVGRPSLNREVYVFDAQDRAGRPVRVIMDAYEGEILKVMPRADGRRGGRLDSPPARERSVDRDGDGEPNVIEGVGPGEGRARRESQAPARPRTPRREAVAPTQPPAAPNRPVDSPRSGDPAQNIQPSAPPSAGKPAVAVAPLAPPAPASPPAPTAPAPAPATEAPGPIPSPPFASGGYSTPPAPTASTDPPPAFPPVTPLDEVKPKVKTSPPVPPASLE